MLAWMDLEMTGLDPGRNVILEIAALVTDDDLNLVGDGIDLVLAATPEELSAMDEVVTTMHTKSGLLEAVEASDIDLATAGARTLDFFRSHIKEPATVPLCGNSIGMDRRFLARWLPEIDGFLHYRSVDVSTLKELAKRWYPTAFAAQPKKVGNHRALGDIRESVEELRYYRKTIFTPAEERKGRKP